MTRNGLHPPPSGSRAASCGAVVVLLCAVLVAPATAVADDGDRLAELDRLIAAGRAGEAAVLAGEVLQGGDFEPRNGWRFRQRLAVALVDAGRPAEAVPVLEQALTAAPTEASLHLNLGRALRAMGHGGRAVAEYGMAVDLEPDRHDWRLEYAEALLDLNIRRDALLQIQRARELCGGCPEALRGEVNLHLEAGDLAAVVEPLQVLLRIQASPRNRALLATTLWKLDDAAGVAALLDTVPEDRLSAQELDLLLEADRRLGRSERALRWVETDAEAVGRLARPPAQAWAVLSEICLEGGEPAAALAAIDRAVALAPDSAVYHHNRAAVLVALGREDEARDALERAQRLAATPGRGR